MKQDLPEDVERRHIVEFFETLPKCRVREVWFGLHQGKGIVFFGKMPGKQIRSDQYFIHVYMHMYAFHSLFIHVRYVQNTLSFTSTAV